MKTSKQKLIQLIHIAKKDLGLNDMTYRWELECATSTFSATGEVTKAGKDSCSNMTIKELEKVLAHLKNKGFTVKKPNSAGKLPQADDAQSKKIRSLWLELHKAGAVRNPSEKALASYVQRITGVSALQWLSTEHASQTIETLKKWLERVKEKTHDQHHA